MKMNYKGIGYASAGVVLSGIYPLMVLWMNNINQIPDPMNILKALGIMAGGALLFFAFLLFILRDARRSSIGTIIAVLIFTNGAALAKLMTILLPRLRFWHTSTLLALLIVCGVVLARRLPESGVEVASPVLSLVFGILVAMNVAIGLPYVFSSMERKGEQKPQVTIEAQNENRTSGRNAYWLLFDEYSSNYVYEKYFGYDNSPFTDWLEEKGFIVSCTSENESNKTATITANIGNLDYVAAYSYDRTLIEDWELVLQHRKNAVLVPLLESHGYEVIGIGSADFYGYEGELVGGPLASDVTIDGEDTVSIFWDRTAIGPIVQKDSNEQVRVILGQLEYLQDPGNIPESNTFILSHLNIPHTPFLFDEKGNVLPSSERVDPKNYVGQSRYLNMHIQAIVETILDNDPTAMIAVMSDHGRRAGVPYDDDRRIFAALYNGEGKKIDIEGMSGMNVMITMLNTILGTEIEYVPFRVMEEVTTH